MPGMSIEKEELRIFKEQMELVCSFRDRWNGCCYYIVQEIAQETIDEAAAVELSCVDFMHFLLLRVWIKI